MLRLVSVYYYHKTVQTIPQEYHDVLSKYNPYYSGLSEELQGRFRKRVFITNKFLTYSAHKFSGVSETMKIIIASALIQITFGLKLYTFTRFNKVYVVPYDSYKFMEHENIVGHVDYHANIIAVSWPAVKSGFIIPDDAYNVALHEVAHAIQEENKMIKWSAEFFDSHHLREWEKEAIKKYTIINAKEHKFLKTYGGKNMLEMFAVCVETFFEQPDEFKVKLPELYLTLVNLFKQDPTNRSHPPLNNEN